MIFDSHSHTEFSADSDMKAADALEAARRQGIGLVFTEHLDYLFPGDEKFVFDPKAYWKTYEPLRGEDLRLGVEVGMREDTAEDSRAFVKEAPFDLVIGSIHVLNNKDLYYPDYYEGKEKQDVYHRYYTAMAEEIRRHDFVDVLGHIDYIARYAPYANPEVEYGTFADDIDAVLRAVIETGKVMELNTRRLGSRRAMKELAPVYTRYRELGGQFVTLGSDAHKAEAIGMNFAAAEDFTDALGLTIVTFAERKIIPLSK